MAAAEFDPYVDGKRFLRFSRAFIRQTKGRWAGKPLVVEPWQARVIAELLRRDPVTGRRVYSEGLVGIPRKNGKSTISSALALYFLIVEGTLNDPGAEIYAAAGSKDQARIVFEQTKAFVLSSPRIAALCDVQKDRIVVRETGAVFRVLSSDAPRQHGLNPSLVIIDELHAHKNGDLYEALTTGDLAREEPLAVTITTAGDDVENSILGELFSKVYGIRPKVDRATGLFIPDRKKPADLFGAWWTVADEDLDNPAAWKLANPASWITEERLAKKAPPRTKRGSWERLHLNRWTKAEEAWLPVGAWESCETEDVRLEEGDPVFIGLDLGRKRDTTAVVLIGPEKLDPALGIARRPVEAMVWGVHDDPSKPPPSAHELVEGKIDFALVEDYVRHVARRFDVVEVGFDPWHFDRSAEDLSDEGLEMVEFPQSNERMAPASQGLYDDVLALRLAHNGDDVLRSHIEAAVARDIGRDVWRLDKKKAKAASDGAFALAIGLAVAKASEGGGGFSVRGMNDRGDATPDPEDVPEGLDDRIADLVFRGIPLDVSKLSEDGVRILVQKLREAADAFFDRGEDARAEACINAVPVVRAAAVGASE